MHARISEIDADRGAVPAVEGLVRLDRNRTAVDPAGDERMVAHQLGRIDLTHDLAFARLRDLAILRTDSDDDPMLRNTRLCPETPGGSQKAALDEISVQEVHRRRSDEAGD